MGRALLILSLGMFTLFGITQISEFGRMKVIANRNNTQAKQAQALYIASSVADMAIQRLRDNYSNRDDIQINGYLDGEGSVKIYDTNSSSLPPTSSVSSLDQYEVLLMCEGKYKGQIRNIEILLTIPSFSRYAYFTNLERMANGQRIYFYDNDVINGPVHTNGVFSMYGSPTFNGEVTSIGDWEGSGRNGRRLSTDKPQFNKGFSILDGPIELPDASQLNELKDESIRNGIHYDKNLILEFEGDKVVVSERLWTGGARWLETRDLSSFNGIISSSGKIYMRGVVDGQVTVHAQDDVVITGDLKYKDDPLTTPSNDILGIISEKNVIVDKNAHRAEGYKDLQIDATIMALDESFTVEDYTNGSRGTLNLLGGIVQQRRGAVGLVSGEGYSKNYRYDARLSKIYPPFFPRASRFDIVYWNE